MEVKFFSSSSGYVAEGVPAVVRIGNRDVALRKGWNASNYRSSVVVASVIDPNPGAFVTIKGRLYVEYQDGSLAPVTGWTSPTGDPLTTTAILADVRPVATEDDIAAAEAERRIDIAFAAAKLALPNKVVKRETVATVLDKEATGAVVIKPKASDKQPRP